MSKKDGNTQKTSVINESLQILQLKLKEREKELMDALEKLSIYEAQNMVPSDESVKKSPGESLTNNQVALDRLKEENQEKDSIIEALQQENLRLKKIEENTAHKTSKTKFIRQSTSPSILQTSRTTPSTSFHRGGSFTMDIAEFPLSTDRFDSDSFYGPNNSLSVDSHAPHTHYWKEQFEEAIVMRKQCRSPPPVSKVTRPKRVLFQGPQVKSKGFLESDEKVIPNSRIYGMGNRQMSLVSELNRVFD